MIGFRFYNYGCMLTCTFPFQVLCNALAPQTQQRQQRMMQQQMMMPRMLLERMVQERLAETATDLTLIMTRLSKLLSGVLDHAPRPHPLPTV